MRQARAADERFVQEMIRRERHHPLDVGTTSKGGRYRVSREVVRAMRGLVTGLPGNGKTMLIVMLAAWWALRALVTGDDGVFDLSPKRDLLDGVVRLLARHLGRLPRRVWQPAIERVQIFDPFRRTRGWALLEPQPRVSASTHAAIVAQALLSFGMHLGEIQLPVLVALLTLGVTEGWSPLDLLYRIYDTPGIVEAAKRCPVTDTRLFLTSRYARLGRGVVDGIAARLRMLVLACDETKAVFARVGPAFDTTRALEPGNVSLVSTADAPLGAAGASQAMNALVLATGLGYAMTDPNRRTDGTTLVLVDEAHVPAAIPSAAEALSAALSRGRAFNIAPVYVCQAEAQFDARMREVFAASINTRVVFAGSSADMEAARAWLTPTGAVAKPLRPGERPSPELSLQTAAEEELSLARELRAMPPRHCLIAERHQTFGARIVRTSDVLIPGDDELDPEVMAALDERAGLALPEAARRVRAIEDELAQRLDGSVGAVTAATVMPLIAGDGERGGPKGGAL
ncbi:MAG: hypothetical protein K8H88_29685 [Sandaracinaceae bacterium]|nr:hypothetical protein [Sandaracinaceae bacterium]